MFETLRRVLRARAAELDGSGGHEEGFTLIELMVVLLIIAILLAIAIPTFLGVTGSARDRSAQSLLTNVLTETQAAYQDAQQYPVTSPVTYYSSTDPQFNWQDGTPTGATPAAPVGTACSTSDTRCVSVMPVNVGTAGDHEGLIISVMSSSGTCWASINLQVNPATITGDPAAFTASSGAATAGTFFAKSQSPAPAGSCWAGNFLTAKKWGNNYATAPAN